VENVVLIPYVSMHGSTEAMVSFVTEKLMEHGIIVKPFNLPKTDLGEVAIALVDAATIILGTSTVLTGPHPAAVYAVTLVNALRPKVKFATIIGSYGWGGKTVEIIKNNMTNLKVDLLDPVLIKGHPKEEDFKALEDLVEKIAARHKKLN
jgi:flavorubredoxin